MLANFGIFDHQFATVGATHVRFRRRAESSGCLQVGFVEGDLAPPTQKKRNDEGSEVFGNAGIWIFSDISDAKKYCAASQEKENYRKNFHKFQFVREIYALKPKTWSWVNSVVSPGKCPCNSCRSPVEKPVISPT